MDPIPSSADAAPTAPYAKNQTSNWRLDLGAELTRDGVSFRVWAPERKTVEVILESEGRPSLLSPKVTAIFRPGLRDRVRVVFIDTA